MCRLVLLLALAAALLTAETAAAAPFVPQASLALAHPDCVAATGAPGELVRSVADPTQRMALLHAGPAGIAAGQQVTFGDPPDALAIPHDCVSVSARPDGSGIAAAAAHAADGSLRIMAATRPAGGSFGAPVALTDPIAGDSVFGATAVLDDAGDAW
jgi:hypothetical protein